jgi:hypothetical protein
MAEWLTDEPFTQRRRADHHLIRQARTAEGGQVDDDVGVDQAPRAGLTSHG